MWKKYGRSTYKNMIQRMHIARWVTKTADTHSEYEIFMAFPRQQWLHERSSLSHLYVHRLSSTYIPTVLLVWLRPMNQTQAILRDHNFHVALFLLFNKT